MSAGNQHINHYSAADFQRYHAGQMSPSEMHALEKAALNDPFLQDALEGYLLTHTAEADIAALKKRLPQKEEEAKIIPLTTNYFNRFLKIAAVLVLFAGFSWLIYKNAAPEKTELAVLDNTPQTAPPPSPVTPGEPAVKETMAETQQENPSITRKQKAAEKPDPSTPVVSPVPQDERKDMVITDVEELQMEPPPSVQKEVSTYYNNQPANNVVNGFITDQSGNRLNNAIVRNNANNAVVPVDRNGNFNIVTDDKAPEVTITALGYAKTEVLLRKDTARQQIVLKDNNLESVVISSNARAKKTADAKNVAVQKVLAKQLEGKVSGIVGGHDTAVITNAVPLQGFAVYQAYLATAMKNARETVPPGQEAKVLLSFTVNDVGKAIQIKVKRSASVLCDNEAIRILRDSPGFTITDKQKPAEIELSF